MKWGHDFGSFFGLLLAAFCACAFLAYAGAVVLASVRQVRATKRFGEPSVLAGLVTYDATGRRAVKAVLLIAGMLFAFVALARPKFGSGTKIVPATNLDVVIVLDYSKSMYARDVVPSRIARAKAEVARLIRDLPGARFGAVAFAGEPMSFPLTSDGAAIAQFFRQLDPDDMPVGGTATARALEAAREVFARDPKAKDHVRVIVLVTDGEDLEGDPVAVADNCAKEDTRIDVVQIGGRAPEVIPDVAPDGKITGLRRDDDGKPLTTELSAEESTTRARGAADGGNDRSCRARRNRDRSSGERTAKNDARRAEREGRDGLRRRVRVAARPRGRAPGLRGRGGGGAAAQASGMKRLRLFLRIAVCASALGSVACGWNPSRPFERDAPPVSEAIAQLDAGNVAPAATKLEEYLSTGPCKDGNIGTPDVLKQRSDGTFDLGLALFRVGEQYGKRFGEEEESGGSDENAHARRHDSVECARRVLQVVAENEAESPDLRARALYLQGNLAFLDGEYEDAVRAYDSALVIAPGQFDAGDSVGRDAAWNRAIALRRIDDKKDAGSDASRDGASDASEPSDGGDGHHDGGDDRPKDAGRDGQSGDHDGGGESPDASPQPESADAAEPPREASAPPPSTNEDERVLDQLESAPTLQQEEAKRMGRKRVRGMADK